MKTKQVIIALCLIAGFGLLVFFWQQSKTKVEQTPTVNNNSGKTMANNPPAPPVNIGNVNIGDAETPTDAYKMLFTAVKARNTDAVKRMLSQKTQGFAESVAVQQNKSLPEVLENGFTATTFAANLPRSRDERIKDNMGALEVWSEKDNKWEDLPFIKEADGWKLAIGDIFAGTHQSPGKGQAQIESESSNANTIPFGTNTSGNFPPAKNGMPGKPKK
jgi:hypothetical protein